MARENGTTVHCAGFRLPNLIGTSTYSSCISILMMGNAFEAFERLHKITWHLG